MTAGQGSHCSTAWMARIGLSRPKLMARKKGWKMLSNQSVKALITAGWAGSSSADMRDPIHALAQRQAEQRECDGASQIRGPYRRVLPRQAPGRYWPRSSLA
jgi:hypothetical protein